MTMTISKDPNKGIRWKRRIRMDLLISILVVPRNIALQRWNRKAPELLQCPHESTAEGSSGRRGGAARRPPERIENRSDGKEGGIHQAAGRCGSERHRSCVVRPSEVGSAIGRRSGTDQTARTESECPLFRARPKH